MLVKKKYKLKKYLLNALKKKNKKFDQKKINNIADFIFSTMNSENRIFHTIDHVFQLCDENEPLQLIAALFHDIVYFQIDKDFPKNTKEIFFKNIIKKDDVFFIKKTSEDKYFNICLDIFGFELNQQLGFGMNEFLSAYLSAYMLGDILKLNEMVFVISCIEATVPFRKDRKEITVFEDLKQRIVKVNNKYNVNMNISEIENIVKVAVVLANRDVENFSYIDTGNFLANSWVLLLEENKNFLSEGNYYITQYREALLKKEKFLRSLKPENIFHQYKNTPNNKCYKKHVSQAAKNLEIARQYFGVKLFSSAILESLAIVTGGDIIISNFLGDIRINRIPEKFRAEDFLPTLKQTNKFKYNLDLLKLLEKGRASDTSFDMTNSPVSAFLYKYFGDEIFKYVDLSYDLFDLKIDHQQFLDKIDRKVLSYIAKSISHISNIRKNKLEKYII